MKILVAFFTYPRKSPKDVANSNKISPLLLENTLKSLIDNQDLSIHEIRYILIGDDYPNIEDDMRPIFNNLNLSCQFFNININNALRNNVKDMNLVWKQAVQRSQIFAYRYALEKCSEFDYLLISSDDDLYLNRKVLTSIQFIEEHGHPDFVFSYGRYIDNRILPSTRDQNNQIVGYPVACDCIASGTMYKIRNRTFIEKIISIREEKWQNVLKGSTDVLPEDAELWIALSPYFETKQFTSLLIPIVLVDHTSEKTVFKYT